MAPAFSVPLQKIGAKEFRFIEHSGAYFGFAFGILQMIIYMFYKARANETVY